MLRRVVVSQEHYSESHRVHARRQTKSSVTRLIAFWAATPLLNTNTLVKLYAIVTVLLCSPCERMYVRACVRACACMCVYVRACVMRACDHEQHRIIIVQRSSLFIIFTCHYCTQRDTSNVRSSLFIISTCHYCAQRDTSNVRNSHKV